MVATVELDLSWTATALAYRFALAIILLALASLTIYRKRQCENIEGNRSLSEPLRRPPASGCSHEAVSVRLLHLHLACLLPN